MEDKLFSKKVFTIMQIIFFTIIIMSLFNINFLVFIPMICCYFESRCCYLDEIVKHSIDECNDLIKSLDNEDNESEESK